MERRITEENITKLEDNHVFVFGSNLAGVHGAGAARFAYEELGAEIGVGAGRTGRCYALPTKDLNIQVLPLEQIWNYILDLYVEVSTSPDTVFKITRVGCGLAGYSVEQIAPMFKPFVRLENAHLPQDFWDYLNKR